MHLAVAVKQNRRMIAHLSNEGDDLEACFIGNGENDQPLRLEMV